MRIWMPTIRTGTGAEVYVERLAQGLSTRGHEVAISWAPHRYQYCPWLAFSKPDHTFDVVVANSWSAAAFPKPAPLVCIVHHVVHDRLIAQSKTVPQRLFHQFFVKPMEHAAINRAAVVIAVSKTTANAMRPVFGTGKVQIATNGIDINRFSPGERPEYHRKGKPIHLLFVGKPSRRKGFDRVGELVHELGAHARLTVIGPEPERGMALPPGQYLGKVQLEELISAYRAADFLLLPSRQEGFGYAAAESLACGTPVVCVSEGAVAELCRPPLAGIALDPESTATTAEEIISTFADEGRYHAMRTTARNLAVTTLSETQWLDAIEAVLEEARNG